MATSLDGLTVLEIVSRELLVVALNEEEAGECRIATVELLGKTSLLNAVEGAMGLTGLIGVLLERYRDSVIVPLKEALLPLIARFIALVRRLASRVHRDGVDHPLLSRPKILLKFRRFSKSSTPRLTSTR